MQSESHGDLSGGDREAWNLADMGSFESMGKGMEKDGLGRIEWVQILEVLNAKGFAKG